MIRVDLRPALAALDDVQRRQLPFAAARALTASADLARATVTRQLPSIFDRPTHFTMQAIGMRSANKRDLTAEVFVKERQAGFLALQETGGTRTPPKAALLLPKAARRNAYGNLPRGALQRMKNDPKVFVGKPPGSSTGGFFRRMAHGNMQPLVLFISKATYKPRFGFRVRVADVVRRTLPAAFAEAFRNAMATRRR